MPVSPITSSAVLRPLSRSAVASVVPATENCASDSVEATASQTAPYAARGGSRSRELARTSRVMPSTRDADASSAATATTRSHPREGPPSSGITVSNDERTRRKAAGPSDDVAG